MKKLLLIALCLSAAMLCHAKKYFTVDTNKAPLEYSCNEGVTFTVSCVEDGKPLKDVDCRWVLFTENGEKRKGKYTADPEKPLVINTKIPKPGFAYIQVYAVNEKGARDKNVLELRASVGAEVEKIRQTVQEPADFDDFWKKQLKRLAAVPLEAKLTKVESEYPNVECYMFSIKSVGENPATGYISYPKNAKPNSLKARVFLYGYGFGSVMKRDREAAKGFLALSISRHGVPQGHNKEYYEQLSKTTLKRFGFRNNENAENCDFTMMILRDLRAIEYLKTRPEWNKKDLFVTGGSMGAFQTVNVAALDKDVNEITISIPWCADLGGITAGRFRGWRPDYMATLDYFDIVNQGKRLKCKTSISIGLGDHACPASSQFAMYNVLTCPKSLRYIQTGGHRTPSPGYKYQDYKK